jgi:hypothetical protein
MTAEFVQAVVGNSTSHNLIVALLSVGGATFIWTAVQSFLALRNNAESREDKAVARLEQFEEDCRRQLAWERESGAYWVQVAGIYSHALVSNGIPLPKLPVRPKQPTNLYREIEED